MSKLCFLCLNSTCQSQKKDNDKIRQHQGDYGFSAVKILISYILQNSSKNSDSEKSLVQNNILSSYEKGKLCICTDCFSKAEHLLRLHLELEKIQMQILDVLKSLQNSMKTNKFSRVTVEEDIKNDLWHLQRDFISHKLTDKAQVHLERLNIAGYGNIPVPVLLHDPSRNDSENTEEVLERDASPSHISNGTNAVKNEPMASSSDRALDNDHHEDFAHEIELSPEHEAIGDSDDDGQDSNYEDLNIKSRKPRNRKLKGQRRCSKVDEGKSKMKLKSSASWECDICLEDIPANDMETHLKTHPEFEKYYTCDICPIKAKTKRVYGTYKGLVWHYCRSSQNHQGQLPCKLCPDQSILFTKGLLCKHLYEIHHPNHRKLPCSNANCSQEFCDPQTLRRHLWVKHSGSAECHICSMQFKSKKYRARHLRRVHPENGELFWCASCPKSFRNKIQLRTHELNHHERDLKKCPHCSKMYPQHVFKLHLRIHGERKYHCQFCTKSFTTPDGLKTHEESHAVEKKFMCSQCPYMSNMKIGLLKHTKRVHGEKQFKCQYCSKAFSIRTSRDNHERIHTGEKPHKCDICDKTFINTGSRLRHQKKKHGIPPLNGTVKKE